MANAPETKDSKVMFYKGSRALVYFVYAYAIVACSFLGLGFFLLLFGANSTTPFVNFVYETAQVFLAPFRGIFPLRKISDTGYFSPSALFAIMMYLLLALGMNTLINYLTIKMLRYQDELKKEARKLNTTN